MFETSMIENEFNKMSEPSQLMSREGLCPDQECVNTITYFPVPKNVHDLKSFFQIRSSLSKTSAEKPLQELLQEEANFIWNTFNKNLTLNRILCLLTKLPPQNYIFFTSGNGIRTILVQVLDSKLTVIDNSFRSKLFKDLSTM